MSTTDDELDVGAMDIRRSHGKSRATRRIECIGNKYLCWKIGLRSGIRLCLLQGANCAKQLLPFCNVECVTLNKDVLYSGVIKGFVRQQEKCYKKLFLRL